jgi:hypothetical protein
MANTRSFRSNTGYPVHLFIGEKTIQVPVDEPLQTDDKDLAEALAASAEVRETTQKSKDKAAEPKRKYPPRAQRTEICGDLHHHRPPPELRRPQHVDAGQHRRRPHSTAEQRSRPVSDVVLSGPDDTKVKGHGALR